MKDAGDGACHRTWVGGDWCRRLLGSLADRRIDQEGIAKAHVERGRPSPGTRSVKGANELSANINGKGGGWMK